MAKTGNHSNSKTAVLQIIGEGEPVQIKLSGENDSGFGFQVNLDVAHAPERSFFADECLISAKGDLARFCFVQRSIFSEEGRALLIMNMPLPTAKEFTRAIQPSFDGIKPLQSDLKKEPIDTLSLASNFVRGGTNASGAILDFYYLSPFVALRVNPTTTAIPMTAVMRVHMGEAAYGNFLACVKEVIGV